MSYRLVFTDTAKEDLRAIAFKIADISKDKELAKRFVKELQQSTKILETFPESGAIPRDRVLKSAGYRFVSHKDYLTFYLLDKEQEKVVIMAIFHEKMDYMRVMTRFI